MGLLAAVDKLRSQHNKLADLIEFAKPPPRPHPTQPCRRLRAHLCGVLSAPPRRVCCNCRPRCVPRPPRRPTRVSPTSLPRAVSTSNPCDNYVNSDIRRVYAAQQRRTHAEMLQAIDTAYSALRDETIANSVRHCGLLSRGRPGRVIDELMAQGFQSHGLHRERNRKLSQHLVNRQSCSATSAGKGEAPDSPQKELDEKPVKRKKQAPKRSRRTSRKEAQQDEDSPPRAPRRCTICTWRSSMAAEGRMNCLWDSPGLPYTLPLP